jgi:membrane-associated phospholipid phosphatase
MSYRLTPTRSSQTSMPSTAESAPPVSVATITAHLMPVVRVFWLPPGDVIAAIGVILGYCATRWLILGGTAAAFAHGNAIIATEHALHLAPETALQGFGLQHADLLDGGDWLYILAHLPLVILIALWLHRHHPIGYRWFRNAFLWSGAIGLLIFIVYPVAPPRYLPGFVDTMRRGGMDLDDSLVAALYNPFAAMPSLHVTWALLNGGALVRCARARWLRVFGVLWPVVMSLIVLMTANHYLLDILGGVMLGLVAGVLAQMWLARVAVPRTCPCGTPAMSGQENC